MGNKHFTAKQVIEANGEGQYLAGKTAVVTGGNSGIGLETCKALLFAGAKVILCTRSVAAGEKAVQEEIVQAGHGNYVALADKVSVVALDLNSMASIKELGTKLAQEERLDFLVLNAGIMALPTLEHTTDGFEKQIGVNHFGHFYLTQFVLEKMKKQDFDSRIVVLSSTAHNMGNVDVADLHFSKGREYGNWKAYGQSKQANLLFAKSIGDKTKGTKVTAVSVHPGVIQTNLWRSTAISGGIVGWISSFLVMDKTIPEGASTTVWGCVSPVITAEDEKYRGAYLADCAYKEPSCEEAKDEAGERREALWVATTEQLEQASNKK